MVQRRHLDIPVIGVAKAGRTDEHLKERASDSVRQQGGNIDEPSLAKLLNLLHYVGGDYQEPVTFDRLKKALGSATRPTHYLAIPPNLFSSVVESLARSGCMKNARVIVEKPFGHDLASAQQLNAALHAVLPESRIFRIDHYLGKEAVLNLLFFRFATASWSRSGTGITLRVSRSPWRNNSALKAEGNSTMPRERSGMWSRTTCFKWWLFWPWRLLLACIVIPFAMRLSRCCAQFRHSTRSIWFAGNSRATPAKRESRGIPRPKRSPPCVSRFNPGGGRECHF